MRVREFQCELWLPQPPEKIFPFFADAGTVTEERDCAPATPISARHPSPRMINSLAMVSIAWASDHGNFDPARTHGAAGGIAAGTHRLQLHHEPVAAQMPRAAHPRQRCGEIDRGRATDHRCRGRCAVLGVMIVRRARHGVVHVLGAEKAQAGHIVRIIRSRRRRHLQPLP